MATFMDLVGVVTIDSDIERALIFMGTILKGWDINIRDSMNRSILNYIVKNDTFSQSKIRSLVNIGADINSKDLLGRTPLHALLTRPAKKHFKQAAEEQGCSAESLQIRAIEEMVNLGARVNDIFEEGLTSMHRATRIGCVRAIRILARLGVPLDCKSSTGSVLVLAASNELGTNVIKCLVELGADVGVLLRLNITPLHETIAAGHSKVVKLLIDLGADVEEQTLEYDPLLQACNSTNYEYAGELVKLGADVNAKHYKYSPIHQVLMSGTTDMLEYLCNRGVGLIMPLSELTGLARAIRLLQKDTIKFLLNAGADVNTIFELLPPLVLAMRRGATKMAKILIEAGVSVDESMLIEASCLMLAITTGNQEIVEMLLRHDGDANARINVSIRPLHDAVARADISMVRLLAENGADLNVYKDEAMTPLDQILSMNPVGSTIDTNLIQVLVKFGADLTLGHNSAVTPLHDAVRLGNVYMTSLLGELGANMNCKKVENLTPILTAVVQELKTAVTFLTEVGADLNVYSSSQVTPLQDAVRQGNIDMVHTLLTCGADIACYRDLDVPLNHTVQGGHHHMLKHLIECGADINAKGKHDVSLLHDAIEQSNESMVAALTRYTNVSMCPFIEQNVSLLDTAASFDNREAIETLLKHKIKRSDLSSVYLDPQQWAMQIGKEDMETLLKRLGFKSVRKQHVGSPLYICCREGRLDLARLFILNGICMDSPVNDGKRALEYLPLYDIIDYGALKEITRATECLVEERNDVVTNGCKDMGTALTTPGLGDVHCIVTPVIADICRRARSVLQHLPKYCARYSNGVMINIGSSAEDTKVGLPNEMDFMFKLPLQIEQKRSIKDAENGFVHMDYMNPTFKRAFAMGQSRNTTKLLGQTISFPKGSEAFHWDFIEYTRNAWSSFSLARFDEKIRVLPNHCPQIKRTERKACTMLFMHWNDGSAQFTISVDIVPCFHVNGLPEGAIAKTWLMDSRELRSKGYVLVPKPPHVESELAKCFSTEELQTLWKTSFPHLETEHMQRLEKRIKDVYLTTKCLRNPDVCRIMILDGDSFPRNVEKYITSYMLKMIFFQNVEDFRKAELSLEEMVYKVYDDLHKSLQRRFIPIFFLPKVNALGGVKVDYVKSAKVANIMRRFVRALKDRGNETVSDAGSLRSNDSSSHDDGVRSVYRTYRID